MKKLAGIGMCLNNVAASHNRQPQSETLQLGSGVQCSAAHGLLLPLAILMCEMSLADD
jgi:hypothetical protein